MRFRIYMQICSEFCNTHRKMRPETRTDTKKLNCITSVLHMQRAKRPRFLKEIFEPIAIKNLLLIDSAMQIISKIFDVCFPQNCFISSPHGDVAKSVQYQCESGISIQWNQERPTWIWTDLSMNTRISNQISQQFRTSRSQVRIWEDLVSTCNVSPLREDFSLFDCICIKNIYEYLYCGGELVKNSCLTVRTTFSRRDHPKMRRPMKRVSHYKGLQLLTFHRLWSFSDPRSERRDETIQCRDANCEILIAK